MGRGVEGQDGGVGDVAQEASKQKVYYSYHVLKPTPPTNVGQNVIKILDWLFFHSVGSISDVNYISAGQKMYEFNVICNKPE